MQCEFDFLLLVLFVVNHRQPFSFWFSYLICPVERYNHQIYMLQKFFLPHKMLVHYDVLKAIKVKFSKPYLCAGNSSSMVMTININIAAAFLMLICFACNPDKQKATT